MEKPKPEKKMGVWDIPDVLVRTGKWVLHLAAPFPANAPPYMSDHYKGEPATTGAEAMLARSSQSFAASERELRALLDNMGSTPTERMDGE